MMNVSVIIPTRNRCAYLRRCLESLITQTADKTSYEVIVIDNGSADDTAEIVYAFRDRLPNLRYLEEAVPGLHRGRNRGLAESRGSILLYADDDIRALPTWIEAIQSAFRDPKVALATGKSIPEFEVPPPAWVSKLWTRKGEGRWLGYYSIMDLGEEPRIISPRLVWGCNFAIRADVLRAAKGFPPDGMPDELALFRGDGETAVSRYVEQSGYHAFYDPSASVYHWVSAARLSGEYLEKRSYLQGISDSYSVIRARQGVSFYDIPKSVVRSVFHLCRALTRPWGRRLWAAYWKGFRAHRSAARMDRELLKWIMRETYMEDVIK